MTYKHLFTAVLCTLSLLLTRAQVCSCTSTEVIANSVAPCDIVVGTTVTVASTSELQSAINQANQSGGNMTILIEDGTYPIASTAQYPYITASNVVFRSASGNRDAVIITGQGMQDVASGTEIGFYAVGDNITIADLTIRGLGNHGIAVTGDYLYVHNVRIQDTYEQMIKGNSAGDGADFGRVQCSLFEYTAGIGPQWYIGGLDIHQGDDWVVSDNVFYDIASPSQSLAEHAVHFWDNSANNTVERNIIVGCDRGIGFGLGTSPNTGGIIRNNMIYNDGSQPYHDVGIGLETSPGTQVYHNSVMVAYQNAIEYRFTETNDVHIANNVCNQSIQSRNGGTALVESNVISSNQSQFVNASAGNLRLLPTADLLINSGINLGSLVSDDIDKSERPDTGASDIGAHVYQNATSLLNAQPLSFSIHPIPADEILLISPALEGPMTVQIYDLQGRMLLEQSMTRLSQLNVSKIPTGNYLIRVAHATDSLLEQFRIER